MIFHVQLFLFHGKLVVWGWWLRYFRHLLMKGDCCLPGVPPQNSIFTIQLSEYPHIFPGKSFNPSPFFSGFFLSSSPFAQSAYLPSPVFRGKFPGNRLRLSRLWPQALQKAGVSFKASWSWWKFRPVSAEVAGLSCRCLLSLSSRDFYFTKKKWKKLTNFYWRWIMCLYIYI